MKYAPKWTPGPWVVDGDENRVVATDARTTIVCNFSGSCRNPSVMADARIIAAAPALAEALFEALKELEECAQERTGESYNNPKINAALRSAGAIEGDEG